MYDDESKIISLKKGAAVTVVDRSLHIEAAIPYLFGYKTGFLSLE